MIKVAFILLSLIAVGSMLSILREKPVKNLSLISPISQKKTQAVTQKPTPTRILVSPTPTLLPTPTPLTGYCLHVPVLLYHHIQPLALAKTKNQTVLTVDNGIFDQQMAYLNSKNYSSITAKQLVDALLTHGSLPPKSILVTLDDGYKDVYDYALPIFQKYHITANLMIPTGLMEGSDYLSWGQIGELQKSGLIYFTNHTWSHYGLARGPNEKILYEIQTAKTQLEEHTGQTVNIVTYPYGSFNQNVISILRGQGVIGAFSTIPGSYQCDSIIMELRRMRVGNTPLSYYGF